MGTTTIPARTARHEEVLDRVRGESDEGVDLSVTRIDPSSAAMALPARPVTMRPVRTGPSSRSIERATTEPMYPSAWNREKPLNVWRARTPPVKSAVRTTTGTESAPTRGDLEGRRADREGRADAPEIVCPARTKNRPKASKTPSNAPADRLEKSDHRNFE